MNNCFPLVCLNGRFVEAAEARVSVFDRGFLYGDGLFETVRVCRGRLIHWPQHLERLRQGVEYLKIQPPCSGPELTDSAAALVRRNEADEAVLRVALSRGPGARGYSIQGAQCPTLLMTLHAAPSLDPNVLARWRCHVARSVRLPSLGSLSRCKSSNKLVQILAKAEAEDAGADEALLLEDEGRVVEASSGNLFWIRDDVVCTAPAAGSGILPGITRQTVLDICREKRREVLQTFVTPDELASAQGAFLTLSSLGIVEIASLDGRSVSSSPITVSLHQWLAESMVGP